MSKLNISRNIFLEKEELNRFQDFLLNDTIANIFLENSNEWGIVRTVFNQPSPDFLIEAGTNIGTVKISTLSKAVDQDRLLIYQEPIDNIAVPSNGSWYWVKISHKYNNLEVGECSININGEVTGVNTKFSEVLRGHSSEVPVRIKFYKSSGLLNIGTYEVLSLNGVTPNLNLILVGDTFQAESGLKYYVIGSTPIFEAITPQQEQGLYFYDSCNIEFIAEETAEVPPVTNYIEDKQFYVARVRNVGGSLTIEDKREQFWTFTIEGISDKLDKSKNLSDLTDVAVARANLGVLSALEITESYFHDSGWKPLSRGVAAATTDFDLKLRRIGRLCIVKGTFKDGTNSLSPNAVIGQIPFSNFALSSGAILKPNEKIHFNCGVQVADVNVNRGMLGYVQLPNEGDSSLFLKVDTSYGSQNATIKFNVNFSFFVD
jgi:hypothetical protein